MITWTGMNGRRQLFAGIILDASAAGLRIRVPGTIAPNTAVRVSFPGGRIFDGETRHCRHIAPSEYHVSVEAQETAQDRRAEPRYPVNNEPVELALIVPGEPQRIISAFLADVSKSGLGLILPVEIPTEANVEVSSARLVIHGTVRNCHQVSGEFRVGIFITEAVYVKLGSLAQSIIMCSSDDVHIY